MNKIVKSYVENDIFSMIYSHEIQCEKIFMTKMTKITHLDMYLF